MIDIKRIFTGMIVTSAIAIRLTSQATAASPEFNVHGAAWTEMGRIMVASDTLINVNSEPANALNALNLNGNGYQSLGAQFTVNTALAENWEAALGFGTYRATHALAKGQASILAISLWESFLTESRLTYFRGTNSTQTFSVTLGNFPFKYNPDVKNLGLYLLRGPVYPGILMGGFQDFHTDTTKSTMLGAHLHHKFGKFSHDMILNSEREIPPTFDWSLAYLAKYKPVPILEFGGGVNFYRLFPYRSELTIPGKSKVIRQDPILQRKYIEIDSSGMVPDTTFFTHRGVKLVGMFNLDLKPIFSINSMGENDLRFYGEAAVIGVQNYGKTYGDITRRIPVMFGVNLPTFRLLDYLSVELEWYGSRYRNDLTRIGNNNSVAPWTNQQHPIPSPKPPSYSDYGFNDQGVWVDPADSTHIVNIKGTDVDKENLFKDNFKWSVFLEKTVSKHIRFTIQVANDHYRPRPIATGLIFSNGGTAEALSSPKDWYFMFRMGYFF